MSFLNIIEEYIDLLSMCPVSAIYSSTGESSVDIRQLANVQEINWRKCNGHSPIGECTGDKLAKVHWTLAIGESPIYESLIGEVPATPQESFLSDRKMDEHFVPRLSYRRLLVDLLFT
jgi:hypothetical protein